MSCWEAACTQAKDHFTVHPTLFHAPGHQTTLSYRSPTISHLAFHTNTTNPNPNYLIALKKLSSLILLLLLSRIALVNSCLASSASKFPFTVPSPAGKSTVCSYSGILGASIFGSRSCCFRSALAAIRRCFLDLAIRNCQSSFFHTLPMITLLILECFGINE